MIGFQLIYRQQMVLRGVNPTTKAMYHYMMTNEVIANVFPRMTRLLLLSMMIPMSTATVERGFSLMNSLCTSLRNRLNQSHLDSLMRICREGKEVWSDYELDDMVDIFKNMKTRRIDL